jgi:predicted ATP-dependent endonuclease of OLD family
MVSTLQNGVEMHIKHVEIGNFRKLKAVRVDFASDKTVFVGANNSGKTSAMIALRHFLVDSSAFAITDFTLSNWKALNESAQQWENAVAANEPLPPVDWNSVLPFLDVWLHAEFSELRYVRPLLATIDWAGGLIGVRLRFEPEDIEELQAEYLKARAQIASTLAGVATPTDAATGETEVEVITSVSSAESGVEGGAANAVTATATVQYKLSLWPQSMAEFLERRLHKTFKVRGYLLDPAKLVSPAEGIASPQALSGDDETIGSDPFAGLIAIDEISAQRGFGYVKKSAASKGGDADADRSDTSDTKRLSAQLRSYYTNHLDPYDTPGPNDLSALEALEKAGNALDVRLKACFAKALDELEGLGYPGVTDPRLTISTRLRPTDGLNHDAAVQYEVPTQASAGLLPYRLPEGSNGLGYQNLVSMVFRLMSFRDRWMRVGKAGVSAANSEAHIPPLHLVLVEEPEAHLHAQVQQVFMAQAYYVLRNHDHLKKSKDFTTQLVVSTHSSHVAHACNFKNLRYFRRLPAATEPGAVPTASVVNLSEVFGTADTTERFVTRYLKASHCDLFFADAAIFVEGAGERVLVPHFVEERSEFEYLRRCYLTWLEIGGSHAHRLRGLVEHLGMITLIITDLDPMDASSAASVIPQRGQGQRARNETLKSWIPKTQELDQLLDKTAHDKVKEYPGGYSVRVAYQEPVSIAFKTTKPAEAIASTFEDALLYQNLTFFTGRVGTGLVAKFSGALGSSSDTAQLATALRDALKSGSGKAEFALDLLYSEDIEKLVVPTYISGGLNWLIEQLKRKEKDMGGAAVKLSPPP